MATSTINDDLTDAEVDELNGRLDNVERQAVEAARLLDSIEAKLDKIEARRAAATRA